MPLPPPGLPLLFAALCAASLALPASASAAAQLLDLRGALPVAAWPPFALTFLGLLAAAAALVAWLRAGRRRPASAPLPAALQNEAPAATEPLLEELAARFRAADASAAELCLALAALVRSALACRTALPASRLTTAELLERMACCGLLPEAELELAGRLLSFCDTVKFAGHDPDAAEASWALSLAGELLGEAGEEAHEVP